MQETTLTKPADKAVVKDPAKLTELRRKQSKTKLKQ